MPNFLKPNTWFSSDQNDQVDNKIQQDLNKALRKSEFINQEVDFKEKKTDQLAVTTHGSHEFFGSIKDPLKQMGLAELYADNAYARMLSFNYGDNKYRRLQEYRKLAEEEMLEGCVHEISTACVASHDKEPAVKGHLKGDYHDDVNDLVNKEIKQVLNYFKFDEKGQEHFREFLTTGEMAWENVFSLQKPELGLLDVKCIMPENLDPIYRNFYNREVEFFNYRKPKEISGNHPSNHFQQQKQNHQVENYSNIPLASSQVTYVNSGKFHTNAYGNAVNQTQNDPYTPIPYVMKGFKANKKLNLIEDSLTRNFIANGTDRKIYNIPVSDMDGPTIDAYMKKVAYEIKRKKGINGNGEIYDTFDPMSIFEDIFLPQREDGKVATITPLPASKSTADLSSNLNYFRERVYEKMLVPIARLNPDTTQSDGTTITAQEFSFAERVIQLQLKFASELKKTVITHLKLKGLKFKRGLQEKDDKEVHIKCCEQKLLTEARKERRQIPVNKEQQPVFDREELAGRHLQLIEEGYYTKVLIPALAQQKGCSQEEVKKEYLGGMSYWDQFELKEEDIHIEFSLPTNFLALRQQQLNEIRNNTITAKVGLGIFSGYQLVKEEYGLSDEEIRKHIAWRKYEAQLEWEISQISQLGPDFRLIAAEEAGIDSGGSAVPSSLGSTIGSGGASATSGTDNTPPDFGDASDALNLSLIHI